MVPITSVRGLALSTVMGMLCAFSISNGKAASVEIDNSLFAQSAAELLRSEFSESEVSYLLLDARTGLLLASRWDNPERAIPCGSLVKPFTALAYGQSHDFKYPTHFCKGAASGCWFPHGHGDISIEMAIANSCNSYFRILTASMTGANVGATARGFGLSAPPENLPAAGLYGLGSDWLISPLRLARAYLELSGRRDHPGVQAVIAGMRESARTGTGSEVGRALKICDALAKTGTAACTHRNRSPGDGFAVVLAPAEQPRLLLLIRVHGVPGAKACAVAGRMLSRLEE